MLQMEVLKTEFKRRQRKGGRLAKRVEAKKNLGLFVVKKEAGTKAEK